MMLNLHVEFFLKWCNSPQQHATKSGPECIKNTVLKVREQELVTVFASLKLQKSC